MDCIIYPWPAHRISRRTKEARRSEAHVSCHACEVPSLPRDACELTLYAAEVALPSGGCSGMRVRGCAGERAHVLWCLY